MALEIKVPTVGESISEVTVSRWNKKEGDYVEMDELICELESDKATFELNAEAAGVLSPKAAEGDTIKVGDVIATIDTDAAKPEGKAAPEARPEEKKVEKAEKAAEIKVKADDKKTTEKESYATGTPSPAA